ncbi:MAG TPA: hypothetical protein VFQ15_10585, partial [Jiangellaceae bacterium]|nr:hypothetical protein [Jiangellaceae bacterium]
TDETVDEDADAPAEHPAGPVTYRPAAVIPLRTPVAPPAPTAAPQAPASNGSLPVRQPAGVAAGGDALDQSTAVELEDDSETPIFKAMQSAWLSTGGSNLPWSSSEVEAGWDRADHVADAPVEVEVNASGLPVRRPGTMLVPGGITKPASAVARDPEAIRKRLAAHAAGVSRGRSAAGTSPQPHTEAGPA